MIRVLSKVINVMNINNYYKQVYSIVSHHNLSKSIKSTCIEKYINAYML
jgi:hypothetical protein